MRTYATLIVLIAVLSGAWAQVVCESQLTTTTDDCSAGEKLVAVCVNTDAYTYETSWVLTDTSSTTVLSGDYTSITTGYQLFGTAACVTDGTVLTLTVSDTYGDGIFSGTANGYDQGYYVYVNNTQQIYGYSFSYTATETVYVSNSVSATGISFIMTGSDNTYHDVSTEYSFELYNIGDYTYTEEAYLFDGVSFTFYVAFSSDYYTYKCCDALTDTPSVDIQVDGSSTGSINPTESGVVYKVVISDSAGTTVTTECSKFYFSSYSVSSYSAYWQMEIGSVYMYGYGVTDDAVSYYLSNEGAYLCDAGTFYFSLDYFDSYTLSDGATDLNTGNTEEYVSLTLSVDSSLDISASDEYCVNVEVVIYPDNYPEEIYWYIYDNSDDAVAESDNYILTGNNFDATNPLNGSSYLCVNDEDNYYLNVVDDWEDGICCDYGRGSFKLVANNELLYESDGQYEYGYQVQFYINDGSYGHISDAEIASSTVLSVEIDTDTDWVSIPVVGLFMLILLFGSLCVEFRKVKAAVANGTYERPDKVKRNQGTDETGGIEMQEQEPEFAPEAAAETNNEDE